MSVHISLLGLLHLGPEAKVEPDDHDNADEAEEEGHPNPVSGLTRLLLMVRAAALVSKMTHVVVVYEHSQHPTQPTHRRELSTKNCSVFPSKELFVTGRGDSSHSSSYMCCQGLFT